MNSGDSDCPSSKYSSNKQEENKRMFIDSSSIPKLIAKLNPISRNYNIKVQVNE